MSRAVPGPTLVCSGCKKRLNAAGAAPGRRGRCPSCGAEFRVPEAPPPPPKRPTPIAPKPVAPPPPAETALPERAPASMHSTAYFAARSETPSTPIGRGGLMPPPVRAESTIFGTLIYPFWDLAGLAWMISLGGALSVSGLIVFAMIPQVMAGGNIAVMGPFAFGMIVPFALIVGYTLQILSDVLISGAGGEVVHPRWPDIDLFAMLGALIRWTVALSPGLVIGLAPIVLEWSRWGNLDVPHHVALAAWIGLGLSCAWMGLASTLLHDDFRALSPLRVIREIGRVGVSYLGPCFLTILASILTVLALDVLYRISNVFVLLLASWAFCGFVIYESMVVARSLGLCCQRNAKRLGWFKVRERWGVRG